mmetsp:Transcript_9793/g.11700  ORF Transcript_9793/g.11700 Transcript_9793/m.11700 type:complete len:239 (-) Transcript_9793:196-912(-)
MSGSDFSANDSQFVTPRSDRSDLFVTPRSNTQVNDVLSPNRLDAFVTPRGGEDQGEGPFPFTDVHPLGGVSSRSTADKKGENLQWNIGGKQWSKKGTSDKVKNKMQGDAKLNEQKLLAKMFQSARHCKKKEVEAILKQGLKIDTEDKFGNTLYLVACQNGHKRIAKVALRQGANINHRNKKGCTGLHYCFAYGYKELGEYLISKGADVTIQNENGLTCYEGLHLKDDKDKEKDEEETA